MDGTVKAARLSLADRFLRVFSWTVIKVGLRPKVCGPLPPLDEPTVFASRHVKMIDPVILMVVYYRKMIRPLVAKDYFNANRFTRSFYRHAQCIPIDRHNPAKQWLNESQEALSKGESVLIFPEGRRNKSGVGLLPFQSGAALLASRSGARVIPVYNAVWKFPHRYRLAVGEPIRLDPVPEGMDASAWLAEQTKRIQDAVAALADRVE